MRKIDQINQPEEMFNLHSNSPKFSPQVTNMRNFRAVNLDLAQEGALKTIGDGNDNNLLTPKHILNVMNAQGAV